MSDVLILLCPISCSFQPWSCRSKMIPLVWNPAPHQAALRPSIPTWQLTWCLYTCYQTVTTNSPIHPTLSMQGFEHAFVVDHIERLGSVKEGDVQWIFVVFSLGEDFSDYQCNKQRWVSSCGDKLKYFNWWSKSAKNTCLHFFISAMHLRIVLSKKAPWQFMGDYQYTTMDKTW